MTRTLPEVVSIHIAPAASAAPVRVERALLVAGVGIEGDRYALRTGTYSKKHGPDREVTLIEIEALDAARRDEEADVAEPGLARRNIVTRGVALNHLVGKRFRVGASAVLEGIRLCEPCGHLAELTTPELSKALVHRGGLRARIVEGGVVAPRDPIVEIDESARRA